MNTLQTLTERLAFMSWPEIAKLAERSGVPYHTLAKIKRGETTNPRIKTVEAVMGAMRKTRAKPAA
jgi:predicted transcriptional regulator